MVRIKLREELPHLLNFCSRGQVRRHEEESGVRERLLGVELL